MAPQPSAGDHGAGTIPDGGKAARSARALERMKDLRDSLPLQCDRDSGRREERPRPASIAAKVPIMLLVTLVTYGAIAAIRQAQWSSTTCRRHHRRGSRAVDHGAPFASLHSRVIALLASSSATRSS